MKKMLFSFVLLAFLTTDTLWSQKVTLTPFADSHQFEDAKIQSVVFKDGKFAYKIGGDTYKLGMQTPDAASKMCANSKEGQHIHLIVDNTPYVAKYKPEFDLDIEDGEHYILTFLSRSYHESIKTKSAYKAMHVKAKDNNFKRDEPIKDPMIFFSRPKGTYVGEDTKKVMLDFYLVNCKLSKKGFRVKADINGQEIMIDKWQTYYMEGLPMGESTITLTLLNQKGKPLDTPNNPIEQKITLKADPAAPIVK